MDNHPSGVNVENDFQEVRAALFELRDALVELSLSMRNLQFEADVEQRQAAHATMQQLLRRAASG